MCNVGMHQKPSLGQTIYLVDHQATHRALIFLIHPSLIAGGPADTPAIHLAKAQMCQAADARAYVLYCMRARKRQYQSF